MKPLTKAKFIEVIHAAADEAGLDHLQGHGIRIGSTLEYLLRGVPFDVMKVRG
jgi:nucleotide-binding universal stress UspA family protein